MKSERAKKHLFDNSDLAWNFELEDAEIERKGDEVKLCVRCIDAETAIYIAESDAEDRERTKAVEVFTKIIKNIECEYCGAALKRCGNPRYFCNYLEKNIAQFKSTLEAEKEESI